MNVGHFLLSFLLLFRRRLLPVLPVSVLGGRVLQDEGEPVDDVEYEEQDGEGDEEELVDPPVLLRELLYADGVRRRPLLDLVLEVVLADDLDAEAVLGGNVALLLEQDGRVPEVIKEMRKLSKLLHFQGNQTCGE